MERFGADNKGACTKWPSQVTTPGRLSLGVDVHHRSYRTAGSKVDHCEPKGEVLALWMGELGIT